MRTDVKVGLVCVFAVVLAVVCYFTLHDKNRAVIETSENTHPALTAQPPAASATLNITPAPATAPSAAANDLATTPSLAANTGGAAGGGPGLLGPAQPYGQVSPPSNTLGGTVIAPPGAASTLPSPAGTLTPPGSLTTPLIPSPGLTAPGSASAPGLSPTPSPPSSTLVPPSTGLLPPASPFSSPSDNNLMTPGTAKHSKKGKSKNASAATDLTTPAGGSTVDLGAETTTSGGYAIQKGDTLGAIAKRHGITLKAILAANPGVTPTHLKIGQKITIPAAAGETPSAPADSSVPAPATEPSSAKSKTKKSAKAATAHAKASPGGTYTVKKGDTLRKIAKAVYGDENMWQRIFRANRGDLASPNDITAGEVIKLPATK